MGGCEFLVTISLIWVVLFLARAPEGWVEVRFHFTPTRSDAWGQMDKVGH